LGLLKGMFEKSVVHSNCDIIATIDYGFMLEGHREHNADLTILGVRRKMDVPYGVINVNEENYVVKITEKPHYTFMILSGFILLNHQ